MTVHNDAAHTDATPDAPLRILVYSDDRNARAEIMLALGKRPHPDLPRIEYVECATEPWVWQHLDAGGLDLVILDGEAVPAGGMGIARQMKDEIFNAPPALIVIGRPQDAWLATWSKAEAVVPHPVDPFQIADVVTRLLRTYARPKPAAR